MKSVGRIGRRAAIVGAGMGVLLVAGAALASEMSHWEFGGPGPHRMREAHMRLEKFDQNKDGNITKKEITSHHDKGIKSFDGNGDGQLTLEEYEGLWLQQSRRRMVRRFQKFDLDGDGNVTLAEMDEHAEHIFRRLDENGDGTISKKEAQQARKHHHRIRMMRKHRMGDGEDKGEGRRRKDR